eukprot:15461144-Alexandrium_andersonii.AAC.1
MVAHAVASSVGWSVNRNGGHGPHCWLDDDAEQSCRPARTTSPRTSRRRPPTPTSPASPFVPRTPGATWRSR